VQQIEFIMFHPFSREHLITVAIGFVLVGTLLYLAKTESRSRDMIRKILILWCFCSLPLSLLAWTLWDGPKGLDNFLPLHLCDIATLTAGFALLTKRPLLAAMTYFWGIAATTQALLTPAISMGFPHFPYVMFFVQHFAIVAVAFYLPFIDGWRPQRPIWRAMLEIFGWSVAYHAGALLVNSLLGTNFGFASRPPDNPSLIDHLGPWPWYMLWMQMIALVLFYLLALPWSRQPRK